MANQRQTGVSTFTGPGPNRFSQIGAGPESVPRSVRSLAIITPVHLGNLTCFASTIEEWNEQPSRSLKKSVCAWHHLSVDLCDISMRLSAEMKFRRILRDNLSG